jgi:hypothetical protein
VATLTKAANSAKTRWNALHYTQIKASVDPRIAAAFKTACRSADISMASVLSQFMAEFSAVTVKNRPPKPAAADRVSTKQKRRKFVNSIIRQMKQIRDAQEQARDHIPDSLQGGSTYEAAEESIAVMDEVIALLEDIY